MSRFSRRLLEEWIKIPRFIRIFVLNLITIFIFLHLAIAGLKVLFEFTIDLPVLIVAIISSFLVMIVFKKNN